MVLAKERSVSGGKNMYVHSPASTLSCGLARAWPLQTVGSDLCLHLSTYWGKKTTKERKKIIYIYITIYI